MRINIKIWYITMPLLLLFTFCQLKAQKRETVMLGTIPIIKGIKELSVGDQVPNFKINNIINAPSKTATMDDFKDQLVIFDFWFMNCSGCVAAMPHMEALQKKFGNKIKILPVTFEPENAIRAFWKKNKHTKDLSILPSVVEDSLIRAYFHNIYNPHEVWIYKGKVVGITGPDYVSEKNIQKILNGEQINWPVKNDFYKFDANKTPIFPLNPDQIDTAGTFLKYAAISDYKKGVNSVGASGGGGIVRDSKKKTVRAYLLNEPIFNAYLRNWRHVLGLEPKGFVHPEGSTMSVAASNQVVWEVADRSKFRHDAKLTEEQEFMVKNAICFESVNPDTGQTDQQVYLSVIKDMNRLLGLNVRWEKRREKVLVLVRTTKEDKLKSKKSIPFDQAMGTWASDKYTQKGSLRQYRDNALPIASEMNRQEGNPYVFDETQYTGPVDMDLNISSWANIIAIRKAIAPYGLALKEEERLVDKLVFTEVIPGGFLVDGAMQAEAKAKREAQKDLPNPTAEEGKAFLAANKKKPGIITLPSGLQYKILKKGTGAKPALTDRVNVHFTGILVNGKIFDSSFDKGRAFTTGVQDVIKGWTEALQLMPIGSKWEIYIPADLAYSNHTAEGTIPPNSTLIFQIELLSISK